MTVFKYIEDKDVFQKYYSKLLSSRLIKYTSASDDAESNMITKLKDACGFEYTNKLSRMFTDMSLNKDLNSAFRAITAARESDENGSGGGGGGGDSGNKVDFDVAVLGTSYWPLTTPSSDLNVPAELLKTYERFEGFYMNKYSGRKLTWLWQHCRNE